MIFCYFPLPIFLLLLFFLNLNLAKIHPSPAFSCLCYETLFSSLKCNADDQLSGTVPPNQSSSLAGTAGFFTLHTCRGVFFTRVFCLKTLCLLLSCFMWKGEGVGCLLLSLFLWNRNSLIPQIPADHLCFWTNVIFFLAVSTLVDLHCNSVVKSAPTTTT